MTLGDIIKQYRKDHGMSLDEFASLAKISKGYVWQLECNERKASGTPSRVRCNATVQTERKPHIYDQKRLSRQKKPPED